MSFEKIEELLKNHMGLTSESVGSSSIMRAAKQRMRANDMTDVVLYHQKVMSSNLELEALIEESIIPETWFFRDYQPFMAVKEFLKDSWGYKGKLKILSLPCSTGEEPYSIAMSLMQAGLKRDQIIIDGIDISQNNINKAKKANYGRNSFRGDNLDFRDQFFKENKELYLLNEEVRACVRFSKGNILDTVFRPFEAEYDLIFCRNLLIYFDREAQFQAIQRFHKLLSKTGLLFVGHAEMGAVSSDLFSPSKYNKAFAFSKKNIDKAVTTKKSVVRSKPVPDFRKLDEERRQKNNSHPLIERRKSYEDYVNKQPVPESKDRAKNSNESGLNYAESLANSGQLDEAADVCEKYIAQNKDDAQGYYLMGIIREAVGNKESARQQFKKATYLDPHHHGALVNLAMLCEQNGDSVGAQSYKGRADRVKARAEDAPGEVK
ncbi:MAG: hypothetical protein HOM11_16960 [Methylococcales bacterium]|jgi:chemotaxis protein methyltransferase WspC|nr:hypothetical protein [Methylococcales bacterium]MBT7442671.1 hypothetical protein [Methylococcales bacterium]